MGMQTTAAPPPSSEIERIRGENPARALHLEKRKGSRQQTSEVTLSSPEPVGD